MASVCVDIDLDQFTTGELINELRRQHSLTRDDLADLSPKEIIRMLEQFSCPDSIIKQLDEWANQPVVTVHKLIAWKESCGVT